MLLLKCRSRTNYGCRKPNLLLALALVGMLVWHSNPYSNPTGNGFVYALSAAKPPLRNGPNPGSGSDASVTRRQSLDAFSTLAKTNAALLLLLSNPDRAVAAGTAAEEEGLRLAKPMGVTDDSRPSAPLEYLLPAARVGVYIYGTLSLVEELARLQKEAAALGSADDPRRTGIVSRARERVAALDDLFTAPPPFIKRSDPTVSRGDQYGQNPLPIVGEVGVAAQKQKERTERAIEVGLAPRFFEVGELVGERQQWNRLQRAEQRREGASEIRRAFNIYTTNLNFRRSEYRWVGSQEEKSRRIRSEQLPTATEVIRSDLDARDLYRNQVQTALEDAQAEWVYQKKESGSDDLWNFDATELLELLKQAQGSVDRWFGFVPDRDVQLALEAVKLEQEQA